MRATAPTVVGASHCLCSTTTKQPPTLQQRQPLTTGTPAAMPARTEETNASTSTDITPSTQ